VPLLRQQLGEVRANGPYQVYDRTTGEPLMRNGQPSCPSTCTRTPLRHAEVKIVNEMLWRRGADADSSVLGDFRMDNTSCSTRQARSKRRAARNCNLMIQGVPSNAGRLTHPPGHPDVQEFPE
jgi:hypothetical protein